jgi:hypothetical protein
MAGAMAAVIATLLCAASPPLRAFEFASDSGAVTGYLDTTISFGALWRTQSRSGGLIGIANGGTSRDINSDDGNLNYRKGELVEMPLRVDLDFLIKYRDYGVFARIDYLYDWALNDKSELGEHSKAQFADYTYLRDIYVFGRFDVFGRGLYVRAGNQAVNWGASNYILNGINILSPFDVTRLRTPDAEIKDALSPTPMLRLLQEVTDQSSIEAIWMPRWNAKFPDTHVRRDPNGAFFSTRDFGVTDSAPAYTGFGRLNDQPGGAGFFQTTRPDGDRIIREDPGFQYAIALHYLIPGHSNTEVSLYHLDYNARTEIISGIRGAVLTTATALESPPPDAGKLFVDYVRHIHLWGVSASAGLSGGLALQGEYSYRSNQPLQLPLAELLLAVGGSANQLTGTNPGTANQVPYGTEISGFRRVGMHQLVASATKTFGPTLGAAQAVAVAEVGYTHLDLPGDVKFAAPGCNLPQPGSDASSAYNSTSTNCFATSNSWGYRLSGRIDYDNVIDGGTVTPYVAFAHDVSGVGPTFNEGVKALTLGLSVSYLKRWQAQVAYTSYFGGRTYSGTDVPDASSGPLPPGQSASYSSGSNPLRDRDFISASVSYAF